MDRTDALIYGGIGAVVAVLIVLGIAAENAEHAAWKNFAASHDCKIVGQTQAHSDVAPGFGSDGKMTIITTTTPATTGYFCDDGVTYWRTN